MKGATFISLRRFAECNGTEESSERRGGGFRTERNTEQSQEVALAQSDTISAWENKAKSHWAAME
jgi:hypothetical protein